jgi:hypothetical protein
MHDWTLIIPFAALIFIMGSVGHGLYFAAKENKKKTEQTRRTTELLSDFDRMPERETAMR